MKKTLLTIALLVLLVSSLMAVDKTATITVTVAPSVDFGVYVASTDPNMGWTFTQPSETDEDLAINAGGTGGFRKNNPSENIIVWWKIFSNKNEKITAGLTTLGNSVKISLGKPTTTTIAKTSYATTELTSDSQNYELITTTQETDSSTFYQSVGYLKFENVTAVDNINGLTDQAQATLTLTYSSTT